MLLKPFEVGGKLRDYCFVDWDESRKSGYIRVIDTRALVGLFVEQVHVAELTAQLQPQCFDSLQEILADLDRRLK